MFHREPACGHGVILRSHPAALFCGIRTPRATHRPIPCMLERSAKEGRSVEVRAVRLGEGRFVAVRAVSWVEGRFVAVRAVSWVEGRFVAVRGSWRRSHVVTGRGISTVVADLPAARRHDGTAARRHDGTAARRHGGTAARWHDGTTARRHDDTAARRHSGVATRRDGDTTDVHQTCTGRWSEVASPTERERERRLFSVVLAGDVPRRVWRGARPQTELGHPSRPGLLARIARRIVAPGCWRGSPDGSSPRAAGEDR